MLPLARRPPAGTTAPVGRLLNAPAQVVQEVGPEGRAGEPVAVRYPARLPTDSPAWATDGAIRSAGASRRQCRHPPAGPRLRRGCPQGRSSGPRTPWLSAAAVVSPGPPPHRTGVRRTPTRDHGPQTPRRCRLTPPDPATRDN